MNSVNVTVRFSEEELQRLDDLAQRMNKTRSDVVRDLINRFDEALREEVEKERKKWTAIGVVTALESAIVDPGLILRFIRRNVDILGFPDFIIGMVRVRNRVVLFSHHDRTGSQLLQLIRSRVEEDVRKEEEEVEVEDNGDEDSEGSGAISVRIRASRPVKSSFVRAAPVVTRYKAIISNKSATPIPKPTATTTVSRSVNNDEGGNAKAAVAASVSKNQKAGSTGIPTSTNPADSQPKDSGPQASAGGGGANSVSPVGGGSMEKLAGDFAFSLVANLYHKHRDGLLKLIEGVAGE